MRFFSLIEVLIVLSCMTLVATVSTVSTKKLLESSNKSIARERLLDELALAAELSDTLACRIVASIAPGHIQLKHADFGTVLTETKLALSDISFDGQRAPFELLFSRSIPLCGRLEIEGQIYTISDYAHIGQKALELKADEEEAIKAQLALFSTPRSTAST